MAVETDNMSKAQELSLQELYDSLLKLSHNKSVIMEDRLTAAFTAGQIKVALHYESTQIVDSCMVGVLQAQKLITDYGV